MTCKNCGLKSCRCYESSGLDSEGEDIFYVSDLSQSIYSDSGDNSSDEDYVYNSSGETSDDG